MNATPSSIRAATTLALWSAAWQAGQSADQVLAALAPAGHRAGVRAATAAVAATSGLPGPGEATAGTAALLPLLRRGGPAALLLPVPGDVRGLPPGSPALLPALDAGAAVMLPDADVALVPAGGVWRAYPGAQPHPTLPHHDATRLVDGAIAEATRRLAAADIASAAGDPREAVRRRIIAEAVPPPPGMPAEASSLLATSITLSALLDIAESHPTAAVTSGELALVDDALYPLRSAVREARRTAVAMAVTAVRATAGTTTPRTRLSQGIRGGAEHS